MLLVLPVTTNQTIDCPLVQIVELTNCSADAAIIALHDANNDLDQAVAALLDGETEVSVSSLCILSVHASQSVVLCKG